MDLNFPRPMLNDAELLFKRPMNFTRPMLNSPTQGTAAGEEFYASVVRRVAAWQEETYVELTPEIKPMSHTRSRRKVTWGGSGNSDKIARSEKIARLEASREANKIMRDRIYEDPRASERERIRQIALTPLDTLLKEK